MREPTCWSSINHSRSARLDRSVRWLIYRPTRRPFRLLCSSFCCYFPSLHRSLILLHYNFDLFIFFCLGFFYLVKIWGSLICVTFWQAWKIGVFFWRCMSFVMAVWLMEIKWRSLCLLQKIKRILKHFLFKKIIFGFLLFLWFNLIESTEKKLTFSASL